MFWLYLWCKFRKFSRKMFELLKKMFAEQCSLHFQIIWNRDLLHLSGQNWNCLKKSPIGDFEWPNWRLWVAKLATLSGQIGDFEWQNWRLWVAKLAPLINFVVFWLVKFVCATEMWSIWRLSKCKLAWVMTICWVFRFRFTYFWKKYKYFCHFLYFKVHFNKHTIL